MVIHKYKLGDEMTRGILEIRSSPCFKPIHIEFQERILCIWGTRKSVKENNTPYNFLVVATGEGFSDPDNEHTSMNMTYIGSATCKVTHFVVHVYQLESKYELDALENKEKEKVI